MALSVKDFTSKWIVCDPFAAASGGTLTWNVTFLLLADGSWMIGSPINAIPFRPLTLTL